MSDLTKELEELCTAAAFTLKDMERWCGLQRGTMRNWLKHGTEPHPIKAEFLKESLKLLRFALKEFPDKLPVPVGVGFRGRKEYIEGVKDHAVREFSKTGSSQRRD